jgi:hypothetical protein
MSGINTPISLNDRMNIFCHHFRWDSRRLSGLRNIHCDTAKHDGTEPAKDSSGCSLDHGNPPHLLAETEPASDEQ